MNTFLNGLKEQTNLTRTENGALAHKTTRSAVYDMFATGGAYRKRSKEDCILLFKNALEEDETLALKCLFYLRDIRGGQGERRFFRICYQWLCNNYPDIAKRNLEQLSEYGRWDDLIYITVDTQMEDYAFFLIKGQLWLDRDSKTPSLLGKWMPSENTSAYETKRVANKLRKYLKMSHKEYRKMLSELRKKINIVERLMSANQWDLIEFDKIPSKAGLIYKNAFARRDLIALKYRAFVVDKSTKVNAETLYPYEIVSKAVQHRGWYGFETLADTDRQMIEKYWNNQKDYLQGQDCSMMCVVDTSSSMTGSDAAAPINIAISLGMYCAERIGEPFKDHFITFSEHPELIKFEGVDFVDKVRRVYERNQCENTNLEAVFDLLKSIALSEGVKPQDVPHTIVVISDMQIDSGTGGWRRDSGRIWTKDNAQTEMEKIRRDWAAAGLEMPNLVYWNVDARGEANILDLGPNVSYVSGASPVIFEQVLTGKTGYKLMLDKLMSKRYENIK